MERMELMETFNFYLLFIYRSIIIIYTIVGYLYIYINFSVKHK